MDSAAAAAANVASAYSCGRAAQMLALHPNKQKHSPWPPEVNSTAPLQSSLVAERLFKQLPSVTTERKLTTTESVKDTQRLSDLQVPKQERKTQH